MTSVPPSPTRLVFCFLLQRNSSRELPTLYLQFFPAYSLKPTPVTTPLRMLSRLPVFSILFDFSVAFETVDHSLFYNVSSLDFPDTRLLLFPYLANCSLLCAAFAGSSFSPQPPDGLFIYIYSLVHLILSHGFKHHLCADSFTFGSPAETSHVNLIYRKVAFLTPLLECLKLNMSCTQLLFFPPTLLPPAFSISIDGSSILPFSQVRNLGAILDFSCYPYPMHREILFTLPSQYTQHLTTFHCPHCCFLGWSTTVSCWNLAVTSQWVIHLLHFLCPVGLNRGARIILSKHRPDHISLLFKTFISLSVRPRFLTEASTAPPMIWLIWPSVFFFGFISCWSSPLVTPCQPCWPPCSYSYLYGMLLSS